MSPMRTTRLLQCAVALFLMATSSLVITTDAARTLLQTGPSAVNLRTAANFTVLAYATVTNAGDTTVGGLLGVSPGSAVGGDAVSYYPQPADPKGRANTEEAAAAKADVTTAYLDAAGRTASVVVLNKVDLGGEILGPGLYKSTGAVAVATADLTLSGDGVFIFQIAETLEVSLGRKIKLAFGAKAENVFWQLGSAATFDVDSEVVGNVMAYSAITVKSGCKVTGRLFAMNEAVSLDTNEVVFPLFPYYPTL